VRTTNFCHPATAVCAGAGKESLPAAQGVLTLGFSALTSSTRISVSVLPVREASTASLGLASPKGFCAGSGGRVSGAWLLPATCSTAAAANWVPDRCQGCNSRDQELQTGPGNARHQQQQAHLFRLTLPLAVRWSSSFAAALGSRGFKFKRGRCAVSCEPASLMKAHDSVDRPAENDPLNAQSRPEHTTK
jgi:hypothetical protein